MPTTLYTAEATAQGGRVGRASTSDGRLDVSLAMPGRGPDDGTSTNPEALFATGYAACFLSALQITAQMQKVDPGEAEITAEVALQHENHVYGLAVVLTGKLPNLDADAGMQLMQAAHQVCPYSRATSGNIEVELKVA